jgi:hypothetical protein
MITGIGGFIDFEIDGVLAPDGGKLAVVGVAIPEASFGMKRTR